MLRASYKLQQEYLRTEPQATQSVCKYPLFVPDYHDRLLKGKNQLTHMVRYIQDNPRRLALKRANKDLFRIHQNYPIGTIPCTVLGNIFLIEHPLRQVLQCSRRLTQEQIDALKTDCLREAAEGTIYLTAAISEGEKQVARALREAGYPLIILLHEGFPAPDDPHYRYFKYPHTTQRYRFVAIALAEELCK